MSDSVTIVLTALCIHCTLSEHPPHQHYEPNNRCFVCKGTRLNRLNAN